MSFIAVLWYCTRVTKQFGRQEGSVVQGTGSRVARPGKFGRNGLIRKFLAVAVGIGLFWLGVTDVGSADFRIVEESEGVRIETLVKNNRIASINPDGFNTLLFCDAQEVVLLSAFSQRYWRGSLTELQAAFETMFSPEGLGALFDVGAAEDDFPSGFDLGELFGALFGAANQRPAGEVQVRVSRVGEETVAGYAAEHYVVETGRGGTWNVYEEVWISPDLLAEVRREAGSCVSVMMDLQHELLAGLAVGMDDLDAVLKSEDYRALMARGYPVRTKDTMSFFGMTFETVHEVVEVSREPIPEDRFNVPARYVRVDDIWDVLMFEADM